MSVGRKGFFFRQLFKFHSEKISTEKDWLFALEICPSVRYSPVNCDGNSSEKSMWDERPKKQATWRRIPIEMKLSIGLYIAILSEKKLLKIRGKIVQELSARWTHQKSGLFKKYPNRNEMILRTLHRDSKWEKLLKTRKKIVQEKTFSVSHPSLDRSRVEAHSSIALSFSPCSPEHCPFLSSLKISLKMKW